MAGATLLAVSAWSQPGFVGAERCKLCHRDVYESWRGTPHATAGTVETGADARCDACHATDAPSRLYGVQCEACHGAGADYWPAEVMIDPDKASMAGLVQPTLERCRRCHDLDDVDTGYEHPRGVVLPPPSDWDAWVHVRGEP